MPYRLSYVHHRRIRLKECHVDPPPRAVALQKKEVVKKTITLIDTRRAQNIGEYCIAQ